MPSISIFTTKSTALLFGAIVLLLSACGGGGGGGGGTGGGTGQFNLQGLAYKGPVAKGTIKVYLLNQDGTRGAAPIASTTTDTNGRYQLQVSVLVDTPVAIVLTGGSYVDEATSGSVSLGQQDQLEAYADLPANGILTAQVTPLTTLAAALSRNHQAAGQSLAASITNATNEISYLFDVGNILTVIPPAIPQVAISTSTPEQRDYTLYLAGFSQLAQNKAISVFDIISGMANNLESNGVLNNTDPSSPSSPANLALAAEQFIQNHNNLSITYLSPQSVAALSTNDAVDPKNIYASKTNSPPIASNVAITTYENVDVVGILKGSGSDTLTYSIVSNGAKGTAVTNALNGNFTYKPNPFANGTDAFTYLVSNGSNGAYGTVTVTINPVNNPPTAESQPVGATQNVSKTITLAGNDVDSISLSFGIGTGPSHGTLSAITNTTCSSTLPSTCTAGVIYTPATNFFGNDSFTFTTNDGSLTSAQAIVSITVAQVNQPPTASSQNVSTGVNTAKDIILAGSDVDSTTLTFNITGNPPSHGNLGPVNTITCSVTAPTSCTAHVTYTPQNSYSGTDSFTFTVSDGTATSNTATVSLNVNFVNLPPVADNDAYIVTQNSSNNVLTVLANDFDPDGALENTSIAITSLPAHGTASPQTNGTILYTPNSGSTGSDSFIYTVKDKQEAVSNDATVSITINALPAANNDTFTVAQNSTNNSLAVLSNDSDSDGTLNVTSVTITGGPSHGSATAQSNGTVTYTPTGGYSGLDSFTYTVKDNQGAASNAATVNITVTALPVATAQSVTTNKNIVKVITLAGTYTNGSGLTFNIGTGPSSGGLGSIGSSACSSGSCTASVTYTPTTGYTGSDSFTFTVNDGTGTSAPATVSIKVNAPPSASGQTVSTATGTAKVITLSGNDADSTSLTFAIDTGPTNGTLSAITGTNCTGSAPTNCTASVTYTPNGGYTGSDNFTFTTNDGSLSSTAATVTVNVSALPVATGQSLTTNKNTDKAITLAGTYTNGSGLTFNIGTGPSNGSLGSIGSPACGGGSCTASATYTPTTGYTGPDSFTFTVNDGTGTSTAATVSITVNAPPVATDDSYTVAQNSTNNSLAVLGNDTDVGGTLNITSVTITNVAGHGTATANADGTVTYTPTSAYNGPDSFAYTVKDNLGTVSNAATVTITVMTLPVATTQSISTNENIAKVITLAGTYTSGSGLTFNIGTGPSNGSLGSIGSPACSSGSCTASVTYTPTTGYTGSDSFTFTVNDGTGTSAPATVNITVINQTPTANLDTSTVLQDTTNNVIDVLANDTDPENDTLTVTSVTQPTNGSAAVGTAGANVTYTPNAGYKGNDSFTYAISDGHGNTATGTVIVIVDPPVMVIVAHPDEESMIAAGVIKDALDLGDSVKVVVVTNGDSSADGLTREAESMAALVNKLGLDQNDVIFLGYPDAGLLNMYNNYPTAADGSYVSAAGKSATYGGQGLGGRDFHSYQQGTAAAYNRANLVNDLKALMARYQPAQIYTNSPVDQDADDRTVFYAVRDAVQSVMQTQPRFRPDVNIATVHDPKDYPYTDKWLKGDAATPAADFSADANWPNPAFTGSAGNLADMQARFTPTDSFTIPPYQHKTPFLWNDRVRMAVPAAMQDANLAANLKYQMIDSYVSQQTGDGLIYAFGKNEEIFWQEPWSRNIALIAAITASSQNTANFQQAANVADGIPDGAPGNSQAEWVTQGERTGAWIHMNWTEPHSIDQVVLFDRPNTGDHILSGTLTFSDGTSLLVAPASGLPNDGKPYTVTLSQPKTITWVRFTVNTVSATTASVGLSEMQVLEVQPTVFDHSPFFTRGPWADTYTLAPGATTTLSARAYDGDGDLLSYTWKSQLGGIITGSGTTVTYQAPAAISSGPDIITVTVTDGVNAPITAQFAIH